MTISNKDDPRKNLPRSVTESDSESRSLGSNPDFIEIIENARAEFRSGKTLSLEDMKHEVLEDP